MYKISLLALLVCAVSSQRFRVIKEWKYLNFSWPNEEILQTAMAKGYYIPEHILMAGINYYDGYYYLGIPRMREGVPATLARISATDNKSSPLLEPFPSWEMNTAGNCDAFQNVQNLEIDSQGLAWIIDSGRTLTLERVINTICPPKLVIYDLKNNSSTIFNFPETIANRKQTYLYDLVVDDTDGGYAYISDNSGYDPGIIVFSLKEKRSWKIRHLETMRADVHNSNFRVNGVNIASPINIAGIALGPKTLTKDGKIILNHDREVYYCPLSSIHLYSISSSILRNENSTYNSERFVRDVGIKGGQTDGMVMDNKGILYYGLLPSNSIVKWNSSLPFASTQKLIARDPKYVQWPNSFSFDNSGNLIALTNNLQKFLYKTMNLDEVNFRLLAANVGGQSYIYDDPSMIYSVDSNNTTDGNSANPQFYVDKNSTTSDNVKNTSSMENGTLSENKEVTITHVASTRSSMENGTLSENNEVTITHSVASTSKSEYFIILFGLFFYQLIYQC